MIKTISTIRYTDGWYQFSLPMVLLFVTIYRKTRHNAAPFEKIFLHLRSCRRPEIELSKFYRRSLSRSAIIDLTVPFRQLETIHF